MLVWVFVYYSSSLFYLRFYCFCMCADVNSKIKFSFSALSASISLSISKQRFYSSDLSLQRKNTWEKKLQHQQLGLFNSLNFPVFRFLLNCWCLLLFFLASVLTHTHTSIRLTIRRRGHVVCRVVGNAWLTLVRVEVVKKETKWASIR